MVKHFLRKNHDCKALVKILWMMMIVVDGSSLNDDSCYERISLVFMMAVIDEKVDYYENAKTW